MASATVRISHHAYHRLRELAAQSGESMQRILEVAIEDYRRRRLFDDADAAFTALRNDPEAWREEMEERRLWENTLADGLETDDAQCEEER